MDINKAKLLQVGNFVHCPADRGEAGYTGRITHVGESVNKAHNGVEYVWITVRKDNKTNHVWPSNRIS